MVWNYQFCEVKFTFTSEYFETIKFIGDFLENKIYTVTSKQITWLEDNSKFNKKENYNLKNIYLKFKVKSEAAKFSTSQFLFTCRFKLMF